MMRTIGYCIVTLVGIVILLPFAAWAAWPKFSPALFSQGFSAPVHITHAGDGSGRIFVVEQAGRIRIIDNGIILAAPFLDISQRVLFDGEQGMLSVAFPPQFAIQNYFYVYYTDRNGNNQVSRFNVTGNPDIADPASESKVIAFNHPVFGNHNGGQLAFGPDGFLYIGTGDGGGGGDPGNNAQNPLSYLGKMLRIDVETPGCVTSPPPVSVNYCTPLSNPFVGTAGFLQEIWAVGLRNPWRFSFDRGTGDLYIGDVGQNRIEEVDYQSAASLGGENYGWRIFEGSFCFNPVVGCVPPARNVFPIAEYDHSLGCAITGGHVYRGPDAGLAALQGAYLYGDSCSGRIWGLRQATSENIELFKTDFVVTTFGEDQQGNLYIADYVTGSIFRFAPLPAGASNIGLFRSGSWFFDTSANGLWNGCALDGCFAFGLPGDQPVMGDWNGDGRKKLGVKRASEWFLDFNGNGVWDGCGATPSTDRCYTFGLASDIPIAGNWDGGLSGIIADKIGVFRNGEWFLDFNGNGAWDGCGTTPATDRCHAFGIASDTPVVGDWSGDGISRIGVFRGGGWFIDLNGDGVWNGAPTDAGIIFGLPGDVPLVGDWNGDGISDFAVKRGAQWFLDRNGDRAWNGCFIDSCYEFGFPSDVPLSGQ